MLSFLKSSLTFPSETSLKETIENQGCGARNHRALELMHRQGMSVLTPALLLGHHLLEGTQSPRHTRPESEAKAVPNSSRVRAGLRGAGRAGIQHSSSRSSSERRKPAGNTGERPKNTTVLTGRKLLGKEKCRPGETCPVASMTAELQEALPSIPGQSKLSSCELRAGCEQLCPAWALSLQGSSGAGGWQIPHCWGINTSRVTARPGGQERDKDPGQQHIPVHCAPQAALASAESPSPGLVLAPATLLLCTV